MEVKHQFVSAKADGPDSTRIRPSNWNADHDVSFSTTGVVMGRLTAGAGPAEEVPFASLLPAGIMLPYAGSAAPSGWALCYGQNINRAANPRLFAAIGTTYGPGDGATTFGVPDARGATIAGKSNMGGSDRANLTGGTALGAYLGAQAVAASISIPVSGSFTGNTAGSISVTVSGTTDFSSNLGGYDGGGNTATPNHTHNFVGNGATSGALFCSGSISGAASGGSAPFSVVQPTLVLNYIINLG